jgi:hypothetical protein
VARPAAPERPPEAPTPLRSPPITLPLPPPPAAASAPRSDGPAPAASGIPWLAQAAVVVLAAVGSMLFGVFALLWVGAGEIDEMSLLRGIAIADTLANRNATPLADQRGIALDTAFVLERDGVRAAVLCDPRGTVLAPAEKLRTSIAALPAYAEASRTGDVATAETEDATWAIVVPVRAQVGGTGPRQIVGYALLEYDPAAVTAGLASPAFGVVVALVLALVAVTILGFGGWWLLLRPLVALREETELALHGDAHQVVSPMRLAQMEQLAHSINRVVTRARPPGVPRPR